MFDKNPNPSDKKQPFLLSDDTGTAMLEFVLIAPLLCFLITGILFFRHELDFANDSVSLIGQLIFKHTPADDARATNDAASDRSGFGFGMDIRDGVLAAGYLGMSSGVGMGSMFAMDRYFNLTGGGGDGSPYGRWGLLTQNYYTKYEPETSAPGTTEPDNPWSRTLGIFGTYFGDRIGGGEYIKPDGLKAGWVERYPVIVNPWQRQLSSQMDITEIPILHELWMLLNGFTAGFGAASPIPRFDNRDTDIGASEFVSGGGSNSDLSLEQISGSSRIKKITL